MADSIYELLEPYLSDPALRDHGHSAYPSSVLSDTKNYLSHLTTLNLADLITKEPHSLTQALDRNDLLLKTLASRSHRAVINSSDNLSTLLSALEEVTSSAKSLKDAVPHLDEEALRFSTTYSRATSENRTLDRRKRATQLAHNVDKISDILELPTLLASVISSASTSTSMSGTNYSTALDLFAYIKRLSILHPDSAIVKSVLAEAEEAMKEMTSNLITSLRGQNIRLAAAIRTIGWLRRVAPELSTLPTSASKPGVTSVTSATTDEGLFGALFLTARLANLLNMLEALSPLRELADQETARRLSQSVTTTTKTPPQPIRKPSLSSGYSSITGQQTERYLKRYIEIFREQSFATVSMYRNVFPPPTDESPTTEAPSLLLPLPPALSTFPHHLVNLLTSTLKTYMPNITDQAARESLLTQVLYAAGSLGRLGADFGMMIALLDDEDEDQDEDEKHESNESHDEKYDNIAQSTDGKTAENGQGEKGDSAPEHEVTETEAFHIPEWVRVMKKHRIQAGRLEALAAGQDQAGLRRESSETVVK